MHISIKFLVVLFLFGWTTNQALAQEENECGEVNKKAEKLYEKGTDRKKYGKVERVQFLKEALAIDANYVAANYALGMEYAKTAIAEGSSLKPAAKYFDVVENLCPEFHSNIYYYQALYFYSIQEYTPAARKFKRFFDFKSDDESKFDKKYGQMFDEAKASYEIAKFYSEQYENPKPFKPKLIANLSTNVDEFLPLISPNNQSIFFTRRRIKETNVRASYMVSDKIEYIERFTESKRQPDGSFTEGEPLPNPFNENENFNYGGSTISLDNREIYLTICEPDLRTNYINCDIYRSEYIYGYNKHEEREMWHWTDLENLGPNINSETGWESQPSLSGDGKSLYYATYREDTRGMDIYVSQRDENGNWQTAQPLGDEINTEGNEKSPFIHTDSKTLYFASDYHLGFGGYDIFYTKQLGPAKFSKPINLGHPINTANDENGFVVSTDGSDVYYSSNTENKKLRGYEVYKFDLYQEARPDEVMYVSGQVKDDRGVAVTNAQVEIKNPVTQEKAVFKASEYDGNYAAVIKVDKAEEVVLTVKSEGKVVESQLIKTKTPEGKPNTFAEKEVKVTDVQIGVPYTLKDINYGTNSAELTPSSLLVLNEFIEFLKDNSSFKIAIYGHTDNVGNPQQNLVLSTDRAFSVRAYLEEKGIESNRLSHKGFGSSKPKMSNATEIGRATNRRTEFVILSK